MISILDGINLINPTRDMETKSNETLMFIYADLLPPVVELIGNPRVSFLDSVTTDLENNDFFNKKPKDFVDVEEFDKDIDKEERGGVQIL